MVEVESQLLLPKWIAESNNIIETLSLNVTTAPLEKNSLSLDPDDSC